MRTEIAEDDSAGTTFSTAEVARLSGASLRQLQYWHDTGRLKPVGVRDAGKPPGYISKKLPGRWKRYTADQISMATVLARLSGQHQYPKVPASALKSRYLLFSDRGTLLCASDDKMKVMRVAAASKGIVLVELPLWNAS
jgi:hypothetical protein